MIYVSTDQGFLSIRMQMLEFNLQGTDFFKTNVRSIAYIYFSYSPFKVLWGFQEYLFVLQTPFCDW